ncbi:neuraminidase-like domain-containing protein [Cyclobacterium jeungdonense]|uniref:Neuraminidase-like domain-containing protein n=1 Tax=Cyclobacterium jeungdonense TaxID=708087 RepID=A0ABT8CC68_9BACT|nr:neuraminidase-like domain-containing protein [Cyclobacterium jeungdonense]MDN3689782.1 neuraminidase-like domain-containing protein [Cyclobacterium jeungdonense]
MITTLHNQSFRPGQKGSLVGRLHRILFVLGYLDMPGNPSVFSGNTQKALAQFQKEKRQQATGLLSEKTAILLEDEYLKSGFGRPYRIKGLVKDKQSGKGLSNLAAEAWVVQANKPKQVAEDITGTEGVYLLEFDEMAYADLRNNEQQHATFSIRIEQNGKVLQTTDQKKLAPGDFSIDIEVGDRQIEPIDSDPLAPDPNPPRPADPVPGNPPDGPNDPIGPDVDRQNENGPGLITGKVMKANRQGASNLTVRAFDKNIGKEVPLGKQTQTSRSGEYKIDYAFAELPRGKEHPDISIKVLDERGKVIGQSPVKYNAPAEVKINMLLTPESLIEEDEYSKVKMELESYLNGASLSDLKEDGEQQDVTYLANKSGWDARIVAMASLAEKYQKETNTPAPFYYALFRAGYPTDRKKLSKLGSNALGTVWKEAGKLNIINQELETQIKKGQQAFTSAAVTHLLLQPSENGLSGLDDMLNLADLSQEEKVTFIRLYLNANGDSENLWKQVSNEMGEDRAKRLQTDGKLGYLTMDNAPLIGELRNRALVTDNPVQLIENGLYKSEAWQEIIAGEDIDVPDTLEGDSEKEKKIAYANQMANRLKVSYPTAVLSHQIQQNEMPVLNEGIKGEVVKFLQQNQLNFQIGETPLASFLKENEISLDPPIEQELKSLERVYKITPSDEAMKIMLSSGIDSAMAATKFGQDAYVEKFSQVMSTELAVKSYQVAQQVHATTLNTAVAYLAYKRNPGIRTIASEPVPPSDILAYPTLEGLFGEMDYCECSHCRSVLSPAAYMVDLLNFIDKAGEGDKKNPLDALLERRPDIEHLQLTCENTHTVLPYIDLVNEILEFFAVHANQPGVDIADGGFNPLEGFNGYNMDEYSDTSELIASPTYVQREAYTILKGEVHPAPFNQPLEALRLLFKELEVPLGHAIESLRVDNELSTWRPVHLERLGLSPEEHRILTANEKTVSEFYGKEAGLDLNSVFETDDKFARHFCQSLNISYKELTEIVETRFINPAAQLLPALERLYVSMSEVVGLIDGEISDDEFNNMLPADLTVDLYGGNVASWIKERGDTIKGLILLTDTGAENEACNFEKLRLLFANGDKITQLEYLKFYRFIKVWKKLGWTIDQTDRTMAALWPASDEVSTIAELNSGFEILLTKLAHLIQVMDLLRLRPKKELQHALALFANIDTHGHGALYRDLFLNSALSEQSEVFDYDPNGRVLTDDTQTLLDHEEAVLGAVNITSEKLYLLLDRLINELAGVDEVEEVPLTLPVVSEIYRYNLLARELKISLEEVLILQDLSQTDPFADLTAVKPPIIRFIEVAKQLKEQKVKLTSLTYFLRHEDLSGDASPTEAEILTFAQKITTELKRIESENSAGNEASAELAREKMSLLYDPDTINLFFSIINREILFDTNYDHHQEALETEISEASELLTYNNFSKKLSYTGIMTEMQRDELKTAGDVIADAAAGIAFKNAIDILYDASQTTATLFFTDNPNLQGPYTDFVTDGDYSKLIGEILLAFKEGLKRLDLVQLVADAHGSEAGIVSALLEENVLNSETNSAEPSIADFLALEKTGINVVFGLDDSSSTTTIWPTPEAGVPGQELPGNVESLSFSFYVLPGESDYYNLRLETDAAANVQLIVDDEEKAGTLNGSTWDNDDPIYLEGNQYHRIELTVENFSNTATLKWAAENITGSYQIIPASAIYPAETLDIFGSAYLRFLKSLAIVDMLELTATEVSYFGDHLTIDGEGFLNSVPLSFDKGQAGIHRQLFEKVEVLLYYKMLKEAFEAEGDDMISILLDPESVFTTADGEDSYLLMKVTGWDEVEFTTLLNRFGLSWQELSDPVNLLRVHQAYELSRKTGLTASILIALAGNDPDMADVTSMENAIRLKYDNAGWLKVIQPINDKLRNMQRDALVAYVLRLLSKNPKTQTVDTADKLFEYFLIDVQMDACMKTSRIKQALSSIQLFINRCLLNLEANVSPDAINKKQWVWMKRYRVWEANRKVFLYPENWLEPELRDNKSPFFKELESELLQSEINADTAHVALLHYLEKLDTVAKLEICAYYLDEKESGTEADDILHVIGRSSGAKRAYYYRRLEYGYWTPWEKIDADIEDNPVLPVVWNGRLFLFWLMVITQGDENADAPLSSGNLDEATIQPKEIKYNLEVTLCWSEYYQNKWQLKNTSDIQDPMVFTGISRGFKRTDFFKMSCSQGSDEELYVTVNYRHWKLYNKHSNPEKNELAVAVVPQKTRAIDTLGHQIQITYNTQANLDRFDVPSYTDKDSATLEEIQAGILGLQHTLYRNFINPKIVQHSQALSELFEGPFFIQNYRHVFYVVPEKYYVPIRVAPDYGWDPPILLYPGPLEPEELPEIVPTFPPIWETKPILDDIPLDRDPVFEVDTDPLTQPEILPEGFKFQEGFHTIKNGVLSKNVVTFGNAIILPTGNANRIISTEETIKNL